MLKTKESTLVFTTAGIDEMEKEERVDLASGAKVNNDTM